MNERIKQLAAKANFGHMEKNEVVYDPRLEKFAELIVRQCIIVVEGGMFRHNQATALFAKECGDAIKEHFGVKE